MCRKFIFSTTVALGSVQDAEPFSITDRGTEKTYISITAALESMEDELVFPFCQCPRWSHYPPSV